MYLGGRELGYGCSLGCAFATKTECQCEDCNGSQHGRGYEVLKREKEVERERREARP